MNTEKKAKIAIFVGFIIIVTSVLLGVSYYTTGNAEAEEITNPTTIPVEQVTDQLSYEFPALPYQDEGYSDLKSYWEDLTSKRASFEGISAQVQKEFAGYLSEEDVAKLDELESKLVKSNSIQQLNEYEAQLNEIVNTAKEVHDAEIAAQQTTYSSSGSGGAYYSNGSGLTMQSGVNYYDGRRETYYSSQVLYHYRTPEWTVDSEGFYRDSAGNYIVATSDMPQGTVFQGSKGSCVVADSGCAAGTTDYYVNW